MIYVVPRQDGAVTVRVRHLEAGVVAESYHIVRRGESLWGYSLKSWTAVAGTWDDIDSILAALESVG